MKKILIDINHPAHVHYFKNFYEIMTSKGHKVFIISRNKEIEFNLLRNYNMPFKSRGKGSNKRIGKFLYMLKADLILFFYALKFNPDIFLSFLHPYPSHVAYLLRKPHIVFSDTDHAKLHHKLTVPFSTVILTPECYPIDLGKKHVRFNGYMELCYLHPNYFTPNPQILKSLNSNNGSKYIVLRFVSWEAIHDFGFQGISKEFKLELINTLKKYAKVFISSENKLPREFEEYKISLPAHQVHHLLAHASLFIGEGATMASECAILGTPAIYINPLKLCYCEEEENKYQLLYNFRNNNGVIEKAIELLKTPDLIKTFHEKRNKMLKDKIDVTDFMCNFIENWPKSFIENNG